jgi:diaminopimelate epimerase
MPDGDVSPGDPVSPADYGARPSLDARFYKAHGLGNDYLVFEEGDDWQASASGVEAVCCRWRGVGADGVVALLKGLDDGPFRLRMFNPDGSEFERSGNGLRILASYLARAGRVGSDPFSVEVGGDRVALTVHGTGHSPFDVSVDMGRVRLGAEAVRLDPAALISPGTLKGPGGEELRVVPVSVGNPHLVVLVDEPTPRMLREVGPFLAAHPALEHGANVQIAAPAGPTAMKALIWERGVGPTSASGTSSCAVAVAGVSAGLVPLGPVDVRMEGGDLSVTVDEDLGVVLRGPVEEICEGELAEGLLAQLRV